MPWYDFDCPGCPAAFAVDASARRSLLAGGCLRCGAEVPERAFHRRRTSPSAVP